MAPNLKVLNVVVYPVVVYGCGLIAYELAMLYMLWTGARAGDSIGIDEVATSTGVALKYLALGAAIVVVAFVVRAIIRHKLRDVS